MNLENNFLKINKEKEVKEKNLEQVIEKFKNTTDALGYEIEPGILNSVALLNTLNYFTDQSCEGHIEERGYPYAWISTKTETEQMESTLEDTEESIYWNVVNNAREKANEATNREDDPENINWDTWDEVYKNEIENHPLFSEYNTIQQKIRTEIGYEKERLDNLVLEFNQYINNPEYTITVSDTAYPRIIFTEKENDDFIKWTNEQREQIKQKSDKTVIQFEKFLKEKYYENKL